MAQSQQDRQFGNRFALLVNPGASYAGKLFALAVLGVVVVLGAAFALGGGSTTALAVGGVAAATVVGTLAVAGVLVVGPLRELATKTDAIAEGDYEVELDSSRGDEVGALYDGVAAVRDDLEEHAGEIDRLNRRISAIVQNQCSVMDDCGGGDLTMRMNTDTGISQFDALAEDFNAMIRDTEGAIGESKQFSQAV
jgi:methyl-accepting chemotaxis protein